MAQTIALASIETEVAEELQVFLKAKLIGTRNWEAIKAPFLAKKGSIESLDLVDTVELLWRSKDELRACGAIRGWEPINRAQLLRFARHRYSHRDPTLPITSEEQIGDLLNLKRLLRIIYQDQPEVSSYTTLLSEITSLIRPHVKNYLEVVTAGTGETEATTSEERAEEPSEDAMNISREPKSRDSGLITSIKIRADQILASVKGLDERIVKLELSASRKDSAVNQQIKDNEQRPTGIDHSKGEVAPEIQLESGYPPETFLDISEARDMLIALREEVFREHPSLSRDTGLLKKSNLDLIIYYRIDNEKELKKRIRIGNMDAIWRECFTTIFEITKRLPKRTT